MFYLIYAATTVIVCQTKLQVILVTMAMFSGYAATVNMQGRLRDELGITTKPDDPNAHLFTVATSCQYIGNLIFRIGHNAFFCLEARKRVRRIGHNV
jgi:hypothetical protein